MTASRPPVPVGHDPAPSPLYLFSPLPPQRNGLADYILEYIPLLSQSRPLILVAESCHAAAAKAFFAAQASVSVIDEAEFLARQPIGPAQILYNLGNNGDCIYLLDYLHRFPGVVIVHDVSLFYLHQIAAQQARLQSLLGQWLKQEHYQIPEDFLGRDGNVTRTPGTLYQECLMVGRIAAAAQGVMVHTAYAEQRLRGGALGVPLGAEQGRPLARIPHFVLPTPPIDPARAVEVLARYRIEPHDRLLLVPGFLTGNKMLYEVLVAHHNTCRELPYVKLLFAGEERPDEYHVSQRIAQLWPEGQRPQVTGYLDAADLDILLSRADLSFVLRHPTYGESSGILPRAAMGGGDVVTVDIGAYAEFHSPRVTHVPVGHAAVAHLEEAIRRLIAVPAPSAAERQRRQAAESQRAQAMTPAALYPKLAALLKASQELHP